MRDTGRMCNKVMSLFAPLVKSDLAIQRKDMIVTDLFGEDPGRASRRLSYEEAVQVHLMLMDGWLQSRIAAHFDVNSGRISEINTGKGYPGSREEARRRRRQAA